MADDRMDTEEEWKGTETSNPILPNSSAPLGPEEEKLHEEVDSTISRPFIISQLKKLLVGAEELERRPPASPGPDVNARLEKEQAVLIDAASFLWDVSLSPQLAEYLMTLETPSICYHIVLSPVASDRLTELCLGLLANIVSVPKLCPLLCQTAEFQKLCIGACHSSDPATILEALRIVARALNDEQSRPNWLQEAGQTPYLVRLVAILESAAEEDLALHVANVLSTILWHQPSTKELLIAIPTSIERIERRFVLGAVQRLPNQTSPFPLSESFIDAMVQLQVHLSTEVEAVAKWGAQLFSALLTLVPSIAADPSKDKELSRVVQLLCNSVTLGASTSDRWLDSAVWKSLIGSVNRVNSSEELVEGVLDLAEMLAEDSSSKPPSAVGDQFLALLRANSTALTAAMAKLPPDSASLESLKKFLR